MHIYFKNVFTTNLFLLGIIKIISRLIIILSGIFPGKQKIKVSLIKIFYTEIS